MLVSCQHIVTVCSQIVLHIPWGSMQGTYADELATIKSHLSENADILIYGCNFGEGEEGEAAADLLASLTSSSRSAIRARPRNPCHTCLCISRWYPRARASASGRR